MDKEQFQILFEQLKNGNTSVLETIYKEYRNPFLSFGSKYSIDQEELLDIYQDSIIALFDNISNGKVESLDSSLKTYLFSIGKYMIFKKLKRIEKIDELSIDVARLKNYTVLIDDENEFSSNELNLFKNCFNKLGNQCQELLQLFYYRGYTLEEIQEKLSYDNYNVVKSQKSRCLRHLKELINSTKQNGV